MLYEVITVPFYKDGNRTGLPRGRDTRPDSLDTERIGFEAFEAQPLGIDPADVRSFEIIRELGIVAIADEVV